MVADVCVHVDLQVDILLKTLPTEVTGQGLEAGVSAHVRVEIRGAVEGFATDGTDVWFDGRVRQSVTCQVARLSEGS